MRIAYLSTFYPYRGGIAQFNASLFSAFEKSNEIRAFNFKRQYPDILFPGTSQMVTDKDNADKIESQRVLDSINPLSYVTSAHKVAKYAPDLILTKFWMPFFGPSLGYVLKHNKTSVNISILDNVIPHEKRFFDGSFTNYFLKQNDGFIVMSDAVKNDLLKLKPDAKYKFLTHPLYDHFGEKIAKSTAREKLGIARDKKVLLFFGFIRKYKGLDLLLETMKHLSDDYLCLVAGEPYGSFDEYEQIIKKNNIENKVKLIVRYISDDEVPLFFSASDVCMLPYHSATQSGITGISYHFGLPVIATDVGGLRESVEPFQLGTIVEKPQENMMFAAIEDYFNFNLSEIYTKNLEEYRKIASWNAFAKGIEEFYQELK